MPLTIVNPESQMRTWLDGQDGIASEYTVRRIKESYARIEEVLSNCTDLNHRAAFDIGSGPGLDLFAMGARFDHVLGIDPNERPINEGTQIAQHAGITNVRFVCAHAEYYEPSEAFSFVFCNLMSHNVDSRCLLAMRMALALEDGGWLHYAEEQEGYMPLEIHQAIQRQDRVALSERIRQFLRGFTAGMVGFRFFASGTMRPLLEALGLRCVSIQDSMWNGMALQESMLCVRDGELSAIQPEGDDLDYLEVPHGFREMRDRFSVLTSSRPSEGFSLLQRGQIQTEADASTNRYAPFLTLLLMADLVLPSLHPQESRLKELDWGRLSELDGRFIRQSRRLAGLEETPIDD